MNELREIFQNFLHRLRQTPLLLGWLLIGPFLALLIDGWLGFTLGLINIALTGIYAVFIRRMTPNTPPPPPVKRPRIELMLVLGLFGLILLIQLFDFEVWYLQPWQGWVRGFFIRVYQAVESLRGIPDWALTDVYWAVSSTIKQLVPTLLVFWLLGTRRGNLGFARPHWKLSSALVGLTAVFGLATGFLLRAPLWQIVALFTIGILVNALPEELLFRGVLLPRLEKVFANPLNALVVSALLFNAVHIPIQLYNGAPPLTVLLQTFSIGYPSGLIWGYLFLRTRSIIPGTLWHAANGNLGFLMMSF